MNESKDIIRIDRSQTFKVAKYLESRKSDIESNPYSYSTLASQVEKVMQFPVSPSSIKGILADLSIKPKDSPTKHGGVTGMWRALNILAREIQRTQNQLGIVDRDPLIDEMANRA